MSAKIIGFGPKENREDDGKTKVKMPVRDEIEALKYLCQEEGRTEDMVIIQHWDGTAWKSYFETLEAYAEDEGFDVWDVFAVMMTKIMGTEFRFGEDGQITVTTKDFGR